MKLFIEVLIGFGAGMLLVYQSMRFSIRGIIKNWSLGLIIAALIYVVFAIFAGAWDWVGMELGGLLFYGLFAFLALKHHYLWIGVGWGLHVLWDIILHPNGAPGYVPSSYPGLCLGFDLVVAGFIFWILWKRRATE